MLKIFILAIGLNYYFSVYANECHLQVLADAGLSIWKKHSCDKKMISTLNQDLKKCSSNHAETKKDEEKFVLHFINQLLEKELSHKDLRQLQISEFDQEPPPSSKEDLEICLKKLSIFFSIKIKDVLIAQTSLLSYEKSQKQCQSLINSLDKIFVESIQSKLKFCNLKDQTDFKITFEKFCHHFKEGCFFLQDHQIPKYMNR